MVTKATDKKADRQERFLRAFSQIPHIGEACAAASISRNTYYRWLKEDEAFAEKAKEAEEYGLDELEAEAIRRAKEKSDVLLIFLLKSKRRHIFGDKLDLNATGDITLNAGDKLYNALMKMKERKENG